MCVCVCLHECVHVWAAAGERGVFAITKYDFHSAQRISFSDLRYNSHAAEKKKMRFFCAQLPKQLKSNRPEEIASELHAFNKKLPKLLSGIITVIPSQTATIKSHDLWTPE